ncbi:hypothetical protein L6R52_08870 [Myxococcota bacterium]|nr:hypothetical protein [Myxococcota bacterium]
MRRVGLALGRASTRARVTAVFVALLLAALAAPVGCALEERGDFLVGRTCDPDDDRTCDDGEECLPHAIVNDIFEEFRCRDLASFGPIEGREAPLAYCDDAEGHRCPAGMVCNADRVRLDSSVRRLVCKLPGDVFAPPYDGGM